jgi:hypothetical protein
MLTIMLAYWPLLSIVLILMLFGVFFFIPGWAGLTAGIVFSLSLAMTILSVVQKQKRLYREELMNGIKLARNGFFEILGIVIAMALAGLLGRYVAQLVTQPFSNDLIKFAVGIAAGLLVGIGVGILMHHIPGRLDVCSTSREI